MDAHECIDKAVRGGLILSVVDGRHLGAEGPAETLDELAPELHRLKMQIISIIEKRNATPYVTEKGELRVDGGLLPMPILDALLQVDADDAVIEKHIHPIGTPQQWQRWQEIKQQR